jgi:hypothetical protein
MPNKCWHVNLQSMGMKTILYILAVLLIIGWIAGMMLKVAGGMIHILLVIAIIAILINVIQGRKTL